MLVHTVEDGTRANTLARFRSENAGKVQLVSYFLSKNYSSDLRYFSLVFPESMHDFCLGIPNPFLRLDFAYKLISS